MTIRRDGQIWMLLFQCQLTCSNAMFKQTFYLAIKAWIGAMQRDFVIMLCDPLIQLLRILEPNLSHGTAIEFLSLAHH